MPDLDDKVIINLCPTGMVLNQAEVPALPVTPEENAADAARCRDAGASMIHVHARDDSGEPTWRASRFAETLEKVRSVAPDLVLVVTTSGRNWPELDKRAEVLDASGPYRPEMGSLTLGSLNFPKAASVNAPQAITALANKMRERGITPELEAFDAGMVDYSRHLINDGILRPPFYYNLFFGSLGSAALSAANVAAALAALPDGATWAVAGIGRHQTAAATVALALGGHVRIGLEDNPYFDWRDRTATTNAALVERVVRIAKEVGRDPATPTEARRIIGLAPLDLPVAAPARSGQAPNAPS